MNIAAPNLSHGHTAGLPKCDWGKAEGREVTSQQNCIIVFFFTLTFNYFWIFTPWDQCWNCVHLSSLHTQLELPLASFFAAGLWVSLTETLRPVRWLLSFSSLRLSLCLFFPVSSLIRFPLPLLYFILCFFPSLISFSSSSSLPLPLALLLSLILLHSSSLFFSLADRRQIVLSKERNKVGGQQILCLSHGALLRVCVWVRACVWVHVHVAHCWIQDSRVIRFPVTACDPKNHEWGPVDSWPGACCRGRGDGWKQEIMASWDNMAAEAGQCWKAYYSAILYSFHLIWMQVFLLSVLS